MPPPRAPSPRRRSPPPSRPGSSLSSRIPDSPRRDAREEPSRASRTDDRAPPSRSRNASPDSAHSKDRDGRDRRSDRDRKALSAEEERLARRRDSDRREADRASDRVREKDKKDRDREKGKEREAPRGSDRSDRDRRRSRSRSRERVKQDRSGSRRDDDREKRERPKQETERKVSASQREPSPKRRRVDDKEDVGLLTLMIDKSSCSLIDSYTNGEEKAKVEADLLNLCEKSQNRLTGARHLLEVLEKVNSQKRRRQAHHEHPANLQAGPTMYRLVRLRKFRQYRLVPKANQACRPVHEAFRSAAALQLQLWLLRRLHPVHLVRLQQVQSVALRTS